MNCPACKKELRKELKGVYCYGPGHAIFLSWEYLKGYNPKQEDFKAKQITLFE